MIFTVQTRARGLLDRAEVAMGAPALVACSAGPDSTVLADVAAAMAAEGRLGPLTLVYVDHGLRDGTAAEAATVRELARALSSRAPVEARIEVVEVDRSRASLEAAARDARYACLDQVAAECGAAVVLLGHTATDQAETVLMRVLRGTGVAGLAGIPERRGRYVRPLLGVDRVEIETYLAERGHPVAHDPMNDDPAFLRVRVRTELMPRLRQENPRLDRALVRLADAAAEQRAVLDFAARRLLDDADQEDRLVMAAADLAAAPPAVAKRAILLGVSGLTDQELTAAHLEAVLALAAGAAAGSRSLDLPGLRVTREYGSLRVEPAGAAAPTGPDAVEISGPDGPYRVRIRQAGDRMRPQRLKGRSRKLSDLYVDEKIPRRLRDAARVAVRESDDEIVWAEYLGVAFGCPVEVRLTGPDPMASNKC